MLFSRKIQQKIKPWLLRDEIIILNGPRQVGKTSLLKLLRSDLLNLGIGKEQIVEMNLENLGRLQILNANPVNIFKFKSKKNNKKNYFFIDEIQYLDRPSNFLKYLYDEHREEVKLIVTGSSSLELKAGLQDSLVGRKVAFNLGPLDFEEFLIFKQDKDSLAYYQRGLMPLEQEMILKNQLDEYLLYGGMPKVVLAEDSAERRSILESFVGDYILKDVRSIGRMVNLSNFNNLAKILGVQIGNLLNLHELANTLGIKQWELRRYVDILRYTFIFFLPTPFFSNLRSSLVKMPKIFCFDLGVRNQLLGNFSSLSGRADNGYLFENFIFLELKNNFGADNVHFFRNTSKTEVDLVFEKDGIIYPFEVKYKNFSHPASAKALKSFCHAQKKECPQGYVVNLNLEAEKDKIRFLPFYSLPQLLAKI